MYLVSEDIAGKERIAGSLTEGAADRYAYAVIENKVFVVDLFDPFQADVIALMAADKTGQVFFRDQINRFAIVKVFSLITYDLGLSVYFGYVKNRS